MKIKDTYLKKTSLILANIKINENYLSNNYSGDSDLKIENRNLKIWTSVNKEMLSKINHLV